MTEFSFIIVSWNAKDYLLDCLASIQETVTGSSYEIIVVDNDSSDGSAEAVEQDYPDVRLIQTGANLGFAKGNNIGIRESVGRSLCLINSDVVMLPGCMEHLLEYMSRNPEVGMVAPRILNGDGTLQPSCRRFPSLYGSLCAAFSMGNIFPGNRMFCDTMMTWWNHDEERLVDALTGCFWLVRREAFEEVGFLDEEFFMYAEDIDWCRRFNEKGWNVAFYPEAETIHHGGASSKNAPIHFYLAMQQARLKYWKKHHGSFSYLWLICIILFHHSIRIAGRSVLYVVSRGKREDRAFKLRRSFAFMRWLLSGASEIGNEAATRDLRSKYGEAT